MRRPRAQAALVLLPLLAGGCFSSSYELDGTAAFSRVDVDGAAGDERADGYRLAGNFSSALFTPGFLRAGQGNGLRGNVNLAYSKHDDNEYAVWSPQVGPSFRLGLGGLFVEPGVTAGAAFAELEEDRESAWAVRPYARIGLASDWFVLGLEGGYQYDDLDFDFGSEPRTWYAGGFFGIRLSD